MTSLRRVLTLALTVLAIGTVTAAPAAAVPPEGDSATRAHIVVDQRTGRVLDADGAHRRFRSASLVKIMIALDVLEHDRDPAAPLPPEDRDKLGRMLRGSDDAVASEMWVRQGWDALVPRSANRLGLTDTTPPADRRYWGYTATSAADMARTYDYLMRRAQPAVGGFVLLNLARATRCAADGYDQYFGIPSALPEHAFAIKQGWSGFDAESPCVPSNERTIRSDGVAEGPVDVDLRRPALHTSGLVDGRYVAVFLSLHPEGTTYADAGRALTGRVAEVFDGIRTEGDGPSDRANTLTS